jgi:hypothetical protein
MNGGPKRTSRPGRAASALAAVSLAGLAGLSACSGRANPTTQPVGHSSAAPTQSASSTRTLPSGSSGPASSTGGQHPPAGQDQLDPLVQRLAPYLQRHFSATYASVLVDSPNNQLVIFRLPDPRLDAAARAMAGRVHLSFVNARYSYARQHELINRILADEGYWRRHGVSITSVGTSNGVRCAVLVEISGTAAPAQRAFDARYGVGVTRLSRGGPALPA